MLLRYHGASTLGNTLRQPFSRAMKSFPGTSAFATDAMRAFGVLLSRTPSAMARPATQIPNRVWNPTHGIVFGGNHTASAASPRALNTTTSDTLENDLTLLSEIEESYVLESSITFSSTTHESFPSQITNDGSWAPSTSESHSGESQQPEEASSETVEVLSEEQASDIHEPFTFKMSEEALKVAKDAEVGSPASFWTYRMYTGPDNQKVKVHYCRSKHTTETVLKYFLDKKVIGFDIEWKPDSTKNAGIKNNVSLIQIASEDRIALFHIALYSKDGVDDLVAPKLKQIMEDPEITKVGVAIKADCTRLRKYLNINSRGLLELSHLFKLVKYSSSGDFGMINKKLVSLSDQMKEHVGIPLCKGDVRGSDWSQALSMDQIVYAASDTYAGLVLNDILESKRKQLNPTPPRPHHAELNIPIRLASGVIIPTADEVSEEPEIATKPQKVAVPNSPLSAAEAANEGIEIDEDFDSINQPSKSKTKPKARDNTPPVVKSPLVVDAENWATAYRSSHLPSTYSANPSALRAYSIWHANPSLSIAAIAALLRDPPLQKSTVTSYIADAIRLEKLPFDKERLRQLLAELPPFGRANWRYKGLWDMVGGDLKA